MNETMTTYDAAIVGGSFAGISAAMQLVRARRRVFLIDAGSPRNRFAREAHGFLGQDGKAPGAILDDAFDQLRRYPTLRAERGEATDAASDGDAFRLLLSDGREARARRIVLATGVRDHLPDMPGMAELWGVGVAACPYCHGYEVGGRRLAALYSGDMSIHKALLLRDWSEDVTLLTNGAPVTAEARARLAAGGVAIEETPVVRLMGRARELEAVELADGRRAAFGAMFASPRMSLASPLAERLGCTIEDGPFGPMIATDARKETTVPGVFAAGDAARPNHSISFAVADGMTAGVSAHQSLARGTTS
jgi:thioredoxin reductase